MAESGAIDIISTAATGWHADLALQFAKRPNRTTLVHRHHRGPLLVQRPFYPEGEVCHIYIVHPPGGIVGGDQLDIRVDAAAGAHVLLTTPAAGKFYRSGGRHARQTVEMQLESATVEWLPQETIFYRGASARVTTRVKLDRDSRFIAWETGCFGLPARDEPFSMGQVTQGFEIWLGERPLLHERLRVDGGGEMIDARWGLAGNPVLGTMLAYPVSKDDVEPLRLAVAAIGDHRLLGMTLVDGLLICRCMDAHVDALKRCFVAIWKRLRPKLLGREAAAPRIWAT
jgi:urease accessory protein